MTNQREDIFCLCYVAIWLQVMLLFWEKKIISSQYCRNNLVKFYKMHPDWPAIWIDNWIKLKENTLILCTWFTVEMNVNQQDPFVFSNFSWKVTKFYGGEGATKRTSNFKVVTLQLFLFVCWLLLLKSKLCLQLKGLMVVGIDTYHDSAKKGRSVGGIVCSMNRNLTRYYSSTTFQMQTQELVDGACIKLRGTVIQWGHPWKNYLLVAFTCLLPKNISCMLDKKKTFFFTKNISCMNDEKRVFKQEKNL